jgi:hypothetical protein
MYFIDIIFIFVLAAILSYIFVGPLGWRRREAEGAWVTVLFVMPLLFFAFWAANLWIAPVGPIVWGVAFFPVLIVGLIAVLLIAAATPPKQQNTTSIVVETMESLEAREAAKDAALGFFFWLVLLLLIASVVFAYLID